MATEVKHAETHQAAPKKGERFRCQQCGMEIEVTADCSCPDRDHVHFECCGEAMLEV